MCLINCSINVEYWFKISWSHLNCTNWVWIKSWISPNRALDIRSWTRINSLTKFLITLNPWLDLIQIIYFNFHSSAVWLFKFNPWLDWKLDNRLGRRQFILTIITVCAGSRMHCLAPRLHHDVKLLKPRQVAAPAGFSGSFDHLLDTVEVRPWMAQLVRGLCYWSVHWELRLISNL